MPDNPDSTISTGKKNKISGFGIFDIYFTMYFRKVDRSAGNADTKMIKNISNKTRAIKPLFWINRSIFVGRAIK